MLRYPITITKEERVCVVSFLDFAEAHTWGEDRDEAKARAVDALMTVVDAYMADRRTIPAPSTQRGTLVTLPPLAELKVALYTAMRDQGVTKAELGRRLHWHMPQVDRILDPRHASRLEQMQLALDAVGQVIEVAVRPA